MDGLQHLFVSAGWPAALVCISWMACSTPLMFDFNFAAFLNVQYAVKILKSVAQFSELAPS
jgi:hypothetical protein